MIEYRSVPLVKQVCNALDREVNNAVRAQELTSSQIRLLLELAKANGSLSFKELEERIGVSQATIAGLVRRLTQKGFIELRDDADDRRVKHAQFTVRGETKCIEARKHIDEIERTLTAGMTEAEVKQLFLLLSKARENLK